jgi:outer membrane protein TolC
VPLSLDPALDLKRAYDLRPDYLAARLGVDRQRYSKAIAQNQLLPAIDLVGSYGYAGDDPDFGAARRQVRDRDARAYSIGVEISVPLTFAQERGRLRAARLALRQAEADLVAFEQDIALSIAAAAGQVETARRRTVISRTALEFAEKALDAETKKAAAGTGRTLDLLQSQNNLTSAQNSLSRAMADERRARANYERELGTTLESHNITLD